MKKYVFHSTSRRLPACIYPDRAVMTALIGTGQNPVHRGSEPTDVFEDSETGELKREGMMSEYLHGKGLAPKVLAYEQHGENDYLLTVALQGEDGVSGDTLMIRRGSPCSGRVCVISILYRSRIVPFRIERLNFQEYQESFMNKTEDIEGFPGKRTGSIKP